jgi:DNA mismatch repair protein MutS
LQVAALAGVPQGAIKRAKTYLQALEQQRDAAPADAEPRAGLRAGQRPERQAELPLTAPAAPHPAVEVLADVDPDRLTPREALDLIYLLKDKLN